MEKHSTTKYSQNRRWNLYLGVDGGGTSTQVSIFNDAKVLLSEANAGPSNPLRVGVETAISNINLALIQACDKINQSPSDIASAVLGIAGVRRADFRERLRQSFRHKTGIDNAFVTTDAEIAHFATTEGSAGLVLIAGTGSICYGKDSSGKIATAGGWGPLAGDEGGGVNIAIQALRGIAKATDGRGRKTELSTLATDYFRTSTPEDLVIAIYSPQMDNRKLAGFAKHVVEAAIGGDQIATEIISIAGFELGLAAYAVIKKLGMAKGSVPIGKIGSIFMAGDIICRPLLETVHAYAPNAFLKEPVSTPSEAAANMAFERFTK